MAFPLLRSHISWSAANAHTAPGTRGSRFGDAKIREQKIWQDRLRASPHQKICRLNILMDQCMLMDVLQGMGRLIDEMGNFMQRQTFARSAALEPIGQ